MVARSATHGRISAALRVSACHGCTKCNAQPHIGGIARQRVSWLHEVQHTAAYQRHSASARMMVARSATHSRISAALRISACHGCAKCNAQPHIGGEARQRVSWLHEVQHTTTYRRHCASARIMVARSAAHTNIDLVQLSGSCGTPCCCRWCIGTHQLSSTMPVGMCTGPYIRL